MHRLIATYVVWSICMLDTSISPITTPSPLLDNIRVMVIDDQVVSFSALTLLFWSSGL